jgi:hypothetical protein
LFFIFFHVEVCHSISYMYMFYPSVIYAFSISFLPYYSTAFNAFHYAIFIHKCNVFQYYSLWKKWSFFCQYLGLNSGPHTS